MGKDDRATRWLAFIFHLHNNIYGERHIVHQIVILHKEAVTFDVLVFVTTLVRRMLAYFVWNECWLLSILR